MKSKLRSAILLFAMFIGLGVWAQTTITTIPPLTANNGSTAVTFEMTTTSSIFVTAISNTFNTGTINAEVWYRIGGVLHSGATTPTVSTANGWVQAGTATISVSTNTAPTAIPIANMSIPINPGTPVGFAVTGGTRYMTYVAANQTDFTAGGATVKTGPGFGFGGTFPNPTIATRQFLGSVTFVPAGPCINPPYAGPAITNKSITCSGETFTLGLDSFTSGTGQTYQWQLSPDNINWTNISGATGPQLITSQTTTNYYRCQVTCGVTVNSASVQVTTSAVALPGGTYTINGSLATGGTNFNSFTDFRQAIVCGGIAGPIVVNVIAKGSPYAEQLNLGNIGGTSATNTITIRGNGETITSAGGAQYGTVLLNGAQHIILKRLKIAGTATSTNFGLHITGGAANIVVDSCEMTINPTATSSTTVPLVISGTLTSPTATGNSGTNITIKNCVLSGGYYGFTAIGSGTASTGNVFENNIVKDYYVYGGYYNNQFGTIFKGNNFNRATRTGTITTFYGMFFTGTMTGAQVIGNRVHSPADQNPTASFTSYPIYFSAANATSTQPLHVANNAVYNINGVGLTYGIYLASGNFIELYHNTISLDNYLATTATTVQRALFVAATTGTFTIKNNLFSVTHGGTGAKHIIYLSSTVPTFSINNNQYYMGSSTGTNNFGYWNNANVATFSAWQTANSTFDQNSVYGDAIFDTSAYKPQSAVGNNLGTNLLTLVPTDIFGVARTATPDMGAAEYSPLSCLQPNILGGTTTPTAATINWQNDPDADSVRIEYGISGFVQGTGVVVRSSGTSITISGLNSQTCYDFYFKTYCNGNIGNGQALITLCTKCSFKSLPLTENFDNTPSGTTTSPSVPQCWTYMNTTGSASVYGYNYNALTPFSAPNHWRMYAGVITPGVLGLISPALNGLTAGDKRVRFRAKSNTANPTRMFVGTITDPAQASSITYLDTILAPQNHTEFTVNIATSLGYNGTDNYVIFILGNTATAQSLYIDDIVFEQTPQCSPPIAITAPTIGSNSAQIAWSSLNGTSFRLEYGPQGFFQGTGQGTVINPATSPVTLSGLNSNTYYDVYVADNCNPNVWAGPFTFKTNCVSQLNGTYTVGGTPGPNNFATLDSAFNTLIGCGITGPVTFNLQGAAKKTIGAKVLGTITGASATNTITFNGRGFAGDTLNFGAGTLRALTFAGSMYVTFQNLTINAPGSDRPVWMYNNAQFITFNNCHIIGSVTSTSALSCVIGISATDASLSATGNNANNITITNCKLVGGYYGFTAYGTSTTSYINNFVLTNNVFENQYYYGVRFYYAGNITMEGNNVKVTRNTATYALYAYYNTNMNLKRNQFFGNTYGAYVYYLNAQTPPTSSNEFSNNFFGGGTYGLYSSTYSKVNIYHNSFRGTTSGFYALTPGADVDIKNNIFVGGSSYAFYNSTNPTSGYSLNYNLYHTTSATAFAYNGAAFANLAAWQTAQPAFNANSLSGNPGYVSNSDFHIIGTLPNNAGFNGLVTVDIDNQARPASGSTTVDIGADEFTPLQWDAKALVITEPQTNTCGDSSTTVKVVFSNLGLSAITSLSATVNVTGATTATLNGTYTGNLPTSGVDTITVGTVNTVMGGNFTLQAVMNLTGDQNTSNDTIVSTVTINDVLPRIPLSTQDSVCAGDFATLYFPPNTSGMNFNWLTTTGDTIGTVDSVQVGPLGANDTTFVLRAVSSTASVGPLDHTIGTSANYTAMNHYMQFTVNTATIIYSVDVFSAGSGLVDVIIQDGVSQATLYTHTVAVPGAGKHTLVINQPLQPGTYRMGGSTVNNAGGLLRNSTGASYPYLATDGSVTITGNTFSATYYYFFYNWQLGGGGCPRPDGLVTLYNRGSSVAAFTANLNAATQTGLDVDFNASASTNATAYNWNFGDGNTGTGPIVTHTYLQNGTYTVTLIVTGVCGSDTITQQVVITGIGMEEGLIGQSLNLYPNPNNGKFRVEFQVEGVKDAEIRVVDLLGQTVYTSKPGTISGTYREEIDLNNQAAGIYMLQVSTEDGTVVRKVTVRK